MKLIELREHAVGSKAVIREDDVRSEGLIENSSAVGSSIVVRKRGAPTRFAVALRKARDAVGVVHASRGRL